MTITYYNTNHTIPDKPANFLGCQNEFPLSDSSVNVNAEICGTVHCYTNGENGYIQNTSDSSKNVRNFFTRIIFSCMLQEWTIDEIDEFFSSIGLPISSAPLSRKDLYKKIWDINSSIPLEYTVRILRNLEPFLIKQGKSLNNLYNPTIMNFSYEPRAFMYMVNHFLPVFLRAPDVKSAVINILGYFCSLICQTLHCRYHHSFQNSRGDCARFSFTPNTYSHHCPPVEWVTLKYFIQYLPICFGCEPFDDCYAVSEIIPAEKIAGAYTFSKIKDDSLLINGEKYGTKISFGEFTETTGIQITNSTLFSRKVIIAEKNYYCPVRKRKVLSKGVAYGAPFFLFDIVKGISRTKCADSLIYLASSILDPSPEPALMIRNKVKQLISLHSTKPHLFYNQKQKILYWNNNKLTSGVQAKLLLEMLRFHFHKNRNEFYRYELAEKTEFIIDQFSTGLTVRVNRALKFAERMRPFVVIERKEKGRFEIGVSEEVELVEG